LTFLEQALISSSKSRTIFKFIEVTMNALPSQCPICGGGITITRLQCDECDITIEGRFAPTPAASNPFSQLNPEQMQFAMTFVKCEGKLNRMEDELNLSYPTLRSRLQDVIRAMGYEPGKDEPQATRVTEDARKRILDDLDAGRISAELAMKMLAA
jgi:hypothetical protein